ncbi:tripartite tricarboxylate transporter substrate binding protein [Pseudoroseomonas wenyumeiae]|uniref:Tripartite tricarboxylate transporter substrate binding protein n=1 Tax=Teichococcus wenyumeiae TaxID=2478470 RepID=A0A3A9JJV5_9PROT|nr:tripartite tricarboxylate transporter substrate binding protein [Pseudoroseomonas wenyumeiae]RKK04046.1 tripartite tricarboxylate transporter substrate binding protein [Pseudoroseomonas wenyumeiae]RMI20222.1 tripartite tricarboxylate transporter substrate binding protein [Pseudoroseomonas wenyumeiae]
MKNAAIKRRSLLVAGAALAATSGTARAQGWPERPIRLVVPFAAGGGGDTLGRLAAQAAQAHLSQPLVVENRVGAGGNIGAEAVARAVPDGYTLLYGTNGTHAINEALYPKLPFRPDADFIPVAALSRIALVVVVRKDLPVETVPELVRLLKSQPGKLTYASAGNGTTGHIASEMFRGAAGVELVHIPYRGNAAAMTDLAAGRVDMAIDLIPAAAPLLQGGAVRALAVTSLERLPTHPDLPTVASVLPGFEVAAWDGIFAPAGTPAPVVAAVNAAFRKGMREEGMIDRLRQRGAEVVPLESPGDFAGFVAAERGKWSAAVRASGARMD